MAFNIIPRCAECGDRLLPWQSRGSRHLHFVCLLYRLEKIADAKIHKGIQDRLNEQSANQTIQTTRTNESSDTMNMSKATFILAVRIIHFWKTENDISTREKASRSAQREINFTLHTLWTSGHRHDLLDTVDTDKALEYALEYLSPKHSRPEEAEVTVQNLRDYYAEHRDEDGPEELTDAQLKQALIDLNKNLHAALNVTQVIDQYRGGEFYDLTPQGQD